MIFKNLQSEAMHVWSTRTALDQLVVFQETFAYLMVTCGEPEGEKETDQFVSGDLHTHCVTN